MGQKTPEIRHKRQGTHGRTVIKGKLAAWCVEAGQTSKPDKHARNGNEGDANTSKGGQCDGSGRHGFATRSNGATETVTRIQTSEQISKAPQEKSEVEHNALEWLDSGRSNNRYQGLVWEEVHVITTLAKSTKQWHSLGGNKNNCRSGYCCRPKIDPVSCHAMFKVTDMMHRPVTTDLANLPRLRIE